MKVLKKITVDGGKELDLWGEEKIAPPNVMFLVAGLDGKGEGTYLLNRFIDLYQTKACCSRYDIYVLPCLNPNQKTLADWMGSTEMQWMEGLLDAYRPKQTLIFQTGAEKVGASSNAENWGKQIGVLTGYPVQNVVDSALTDIFDEYRLPFVALSVSQRKNEDERNQCWNELNPLFQSFL